MLETIKLEMGLVIDSHASPTKVAAGKVDAVRIIPRFVRHGTPRTLPLLFTF